MLASYHKKRVFITGHTGFKGAWLSLILTQAGAEVTGYALNPPTEPSLFTLLDLKSKLNSIVGDIRDRQTLLTAIQAAKPEVVFHLAAQPIVRESYRDPVTTFETNIMGTVNLLECIRQTPSVKSMVNITTDKVYENQEWSWGYRETDVLNGYDPYSNSKSCSELVTSSYQKAFFNSHDGAGVAISTARAGNVIGGGDFALDRIVPDAVRAAIKGETLIVRNPNSTRPYQHVLEPLAAYLLIASAQLTKTVFCGNYNVGPDDQDCVPTCTLASLFCEAWGDGQLWESQYTGGPHEANFLKLDCSKIKQALGWYPVWNVEQAIRYTVDWYKLYRDKGNVASLMLKQIETYFSQAATHWRGEAQHV